jgi:UDP-glucose 4-epimerase
MNILILGAAGFIGTNITLKLAADKNNRITLVDKSREFFGDIAHFGLENVIIKEYKFEMNTDFESLLLNQDVIYHLVSTTVPTTSNLHVSQELIANVVVTSMLLDACVKCNIKKVIFISSGGTVYGKEENCPLKEDTATNPISSYGIQKITIEKLLYLYQYMYGLDYRVIRLANPYGPYQRPNGILGAITTFTYKALKGEEVVVYGNGSVIRDFIYIDDAIRAIIMITNGENKHRTFNLGCGYGISIKEVLETIGDVLALELKVKYASGRRVDVPINYLDISRYEKAYGDLNPISLCEGIKKTAKFIKEHYKL